MTLAAGTRLRCETCSSEAIVITAAEAELVCCGQPMVPTFTPSSAQQS